MSERKDNKNKFNVVTSSFSIHALYKFLVSDAVHATIGCKATHAGQRKGGRGRNMLTTAAAATCAVI